MIERQFKPLQETVAGSLEQVQDKRELSNHFLRIHMFLLSVAVEDMSHLFSNPVTPWWSIVERGMKIDMGSMDK